jgi:hypothetical protein
MRKKRNWIPSVLYVIHSISIYRIPNVLQQGAHLIISTIYYIYNSESNCFNLHLQELHTGIPYTCSKTSSFFLLSIFLCMYKYVREKST